MPATTLVIAVLSALAPTGAGSRMTLSDDTITAEERAARLVHDEDLKRYLASHTVVFVGGFLNEYVRHRLTGNYFRQNIAALRDVLPGVATSRVFPPSSRGMAENADWLSDELTEVWRNGGGKPLAVIGHSKGGAETLLAILRRPGLVLDGTIDDVVLIQSSVGGSPISDCLSDPEVCRPASRLMRLAGRWLRHGYRDGLLSLRTADADRLFAEAMSAARSQVGEERFEAVSRRIAYVRAVTPAAGVNRRIRAAALFLNDAGFPQNDGMLSLQDQRLIGIGSDLGGILSASHADLVCSGIGVSGRSRGYRKAFTRLLFAALAVRGRSDRSSPSPSSSSPGCPSAPDRRSPP